MNLDCLTPTVLVSDDDVHICYLLEFLLKRENFDVVVADNGQKTHELIDLSPPPTLILLDIMLPVIGGFELLNSIRANQYWKSVPIIMLSAQKTEKDIVYALDHGANDYVVKPFQPLELMARIRRQLAA